MKKYRIFLFLLFFGVHFELFAQSSRIWVDGVWDLTEFRDDGSILAYPFDLQPDFIPNSMICTDAGDPLFVYNIWNVKDIRGNTIKGSDSIVPVATIYLMGNVFFQRNDSTYDLIGGYDSVRSNRYHPYPSGYEYDILKYNPMGFYRHSILKTNKGFVMHEKNKLLKRYKPDAQASIDAEYNFRFYKVHRKKDYSYSMVYDHSGEGRNYYDTLVLQIAQVSNGEITKVRRVDLGAAETLFEEPIPIPPSRRVYRFLDTYGGVQTLRGDKLFFLSDVTMSMDYLENWVLERRGIWSVELDPTGELIAPPQEHVAVQQIVETGPIPRPTGVYRDFRELTISPNDSILYYVVEETTLDSVNGTLKKHIVKKVKYWRFREPGSETQDLMMIDESISVSLEISPYGQLLITYQETWDDYAVYQLIETNNPQGLNSTFRKHVLSYWVGTHGVKLYDYVRLRDTIDYTCEALVQFENKSDLSEGMDSFVWYFSDKENDYITTQIGFEPSITYTENGDYPFKCHGFSSQSDYSEWYLDTLHVRIPEKPVPDFEVSETVVCAHVPLSFVNNSSTQQQHPTRAQQWVWTFGDGQTYTTDTAEMVTHAYAQAGVYSVSLHYYNGYCDSTLVKNQYIRVVEAPAPGFAIDNNRGCSPFGLLVTDTITQFVRKKEYNYYDGTGWHEVPKDQPEISVNYPNAGNYWVVQRLYGYTGCITQQDSVRVYVTPGITQSDTVHTQKGSYLNHASAVGALKINYRGEEYWHGTPEQIEIEWTSQAAAVSYHIYRDGLKLATVDSPDLVYYDEIGMPREVEYRVTGEDSCGHETSWGRYARPIYLHGEHLDNEIAVIRFTPYGETIQEMEYQVYVEEMGEWEMLSEVGEQEEYKDRGYAQRTSERMIEKCYVVSDVAGEIWSNVMCLAYQPTVFAPTAFTPNGDGINDVYHIQTYGIVNYEAEVYNRYGQKITSFTDQDIGWSGEDAPMGAYLLHLQARDINGNRYNTKQTISVVR